ILFFMMDYCAGGSAADLTAAGGSVPVPEAIEIMLQVLNGLEYAHQAVVPVQLADGSLSHARSSSPRSENLEHFAIGGCEPANRQGERFRALQGIRDGRADTTYTDRRNWRDAAIYATPAVHQLPVRQTR